ncbi:MAG: response regulator [Flavobacteriales bacterium]|nr:response regulator [Flavobacteriales bacterium]MBK9289927.1 response regulator [Flavobacteriales bacterium]MBL0035408.1 response regulator [Flavobacteriales bacterium]MCC7501920.1 response regulator [Flavobacteriales bacterium]
MNNVLIIEDETIISFGYRLQIERMGFTVTGVARSSEEAEALMAEARPDLIIMDVYLKGSKTGLELAREIHAKDPIPIVFLTASTKPEIIEGIRQLKGCHYLAKPINSDSLADVLQRMLRSE